MLRRFRSPAWLACAILCASQVVGMHAPESTVGIPEDRIPTIERAVESLRERQNIPGLTVAVMRDGTRWTRGFGVSDLENKVPASAETVYRTASIAKPITAVAALKLVREKKLDLDADIRSYVPSFPEKKWKITPRNLLAHLGGIRSYKGQEVNSARHYDGVLDGLSMFSADPLEHRPGARFLYSTYGYNLLGAAVERVSDRRFIEVLDDLVFKPAGMVRTRDDDAFAIIPNRARGYRGGKGKPVVNCVMADTSNKVPGGGLVATAEDLAAFGSAFLAGKLLDAEMTREMTTEQKTTDGKPVGYGLGWNLAIEKGRREISHGGGQPGTSTLLYLRPDSRVVVAIMCNLEGADLKGTARDLADIVEKGSPRSGAR